MICKKCGSRIEPDSLFCNMCGARADEIMPPEAAAEALSREDAEGLSRISLQKADNVFQGKEEDRAADQVSGDLPAPREREVSISGEKSPADSVPAAGETKGFFGIGAFILCVVMIGLLSCSTGIFAALYFKAIGG